MISLVTQKSDLLNILNSSENSEQTQRGFVPTMGNLHLGHLELLRKSLSNHFLTILSIFVNPLQFGPSEDFTNYPRTLENDMTLLKNFFEQEKKSSKQKLIVFAPTQFLEVFPCEEPTQIHVAQLSQALCGKSRPTHFAGVTTVLYYLFKLLGSSYVYMGLKDYQQLVICKKMVSDLNLPQKIIGVDIVRESSGLALSSRNGYLTATQKEKDALELYRTLKACSYLFENNSLEVAWNKFDDFKKNLSKNWDYLEIFDENNLRPNRKNLNDLRVFGALKVGKCRLIDNIKLIS